MSTLAAALADTSKLSPYQGHDVLRTKITIRGTGDGLSKSLSIDPEELPIGSTGYVLLEYEVTEHGHKAITDTDAYELEQVLKAGTATIVDAAFAKASIDAQAERIRAADEAAKGIKRLPYADELQAAHERGEHAEGIVDGCPDCDAETEAANREVAAEVSKITDPPKRNRRVKDDPQA